MTIGKVVHAHDVMRQRIMEQCGMDYEFGRLRHLTLAQIRKSFAAEDFQKLADQKFVIGAFRYGLITDQIKSGKSYDHVASIRQRLDYYSETGDLGVLADVANLCKAEWIVPHHPKAHMSKDDDKGYYAPGRMK